MENDHNLIKTIPFLIAQMILMLAIKTSLKDYRNIKIVSRNLKSGHVNCSRFKALFPYIYLEIMQKIQGKKDPY